MRTVNAALFLAALALFLVSCARNASHTDPIGMTSEREESVSGAGNSQLWGIWDVSIDDESNSITAAPLRGVEFACNVVKFLNGSPLYLKFEDLKKNDQGSYVDYDLDIGLLHPFPGLDRYIGFDVMGVFMGEVSGKFTGDSGFAVASADDFHMLNPDGYTRWFNRPQFEGIGVKYPIVGYIPGDKGTPGFSPNGILNPYKYFADGLDANANAFDFLVANGADRGAFRPGSLNHRHYQLRRPKTKAPKYQYAVVAHWVPNVNHPDPPKSLDDFPASANVDEAVVLSVVDSSTLSYSSTESGGTLSLDVSVFDWSATLSDVVVEYEIRCTSPLWIGEMIGDKKPIAQGPHYFTFHIEVTVDKLDSGDPLPVWLEVRYPGLDYKNPFGVDNGVVGALAGYFLTEVHVEPNEPTGEFKWKIETLREGDGDGQSIDLALRPGDNFPLVTAAGEFKGPDPDPYAAQSFEWTGLSWVNVGHWACWPLNGTGAAYRSDDLYPCMFFARNPDDGDDMWFEYKDAGGWHPVDHVVEGTPTGISCATDPSDHYAAHVACRMPGLWYFSGELNNWGGEQVDAAPGNHSDCWISPEGTVYIVYDDTIEDSIKIAIGKPGSWSIYGMNYGPASCPFAVSGFFDGYIYQAGVVRVINNYPGDGKSYLSLKCLYKDGSDKGGFSYPLSEPADFCSIDFDSNMGSYVAYHAMTSGDLRMRYNNGVKDIPVDQSPDDVGQWCVIKVPPDGLPRIAYGAATSPRKTMFAWGEK
jgi:hypothetical protein